MTGSDALLGPLLAIIYKDQPTSPSLSTILIGRHGISESVNMTISPKSRFYGACLNLPEEQRTSMVRKAIAVSCLRTFSNMELTIKSYLTFSTQETQLFDWDETTAGSVASRMIPAIGRYPDDIGRAILDTGVLSPKFIKSSVIDIIYQDSPSTNDYNNELVYLFGNQLEHLFDPLAEYSPEPTEMLYSPPTYPPMQRPSDTTLVQSVCEELFSIHSHFTSDLLNLLQDFLIPLRVKVLSGDVPGINMRVLNTIFPPTIDEIVRVNNIFYEALNLAMPYGSYEVIKACGISIPYFYKACMRHEATTRNFSANLRQHYDLIMVNTHTLGRFTINRIESIIHCSLHLTKIKMVLDRLIKLVNWSNDELANVEEFYQSAVGTIDSFGKESFVSPYDNRIFTSTGKLLVEISKGWPKELEYGWINRRVVTIFDAVGIMQDEQDILNVIFVFTDSVVVIKPQEAISVTSDSGIHKPSVTDMLMHSMINSVPLPNLPELNVVGWAPIDNVYMAEVEGAQSLAMYVTGTGFIKSATESSNLELFRLIRPEMTTSSIVNFLSKAKIMNKTQPFHLFLNQQKHFSTFATVQEYQGYVNEASKCPIAIFANMPISNITLDTHNLIACIGTQIFDNEYVSITVVSKLAYNTHETVSKTEFSAAIASQVSRLYSLYFASSNPFVTEMVIKNNSSITNHLIKYATTPRRQAESKSHNLRTATKEPVDLKRQSSLRQRLSPATVLSKISSRVSQDLLRKDSNSKEPSKKRRPFSFLSSSSSNKKVRLQSTTTQGRADKVSSMVLTPTPEIASKSSLFGIKRPASTVATKVSFAPIRTTKVTTTTTPSMSTYVTPLQTSKHNFSVLKLPTHSSAPSKNQTKMRKVSFFDTPASEPQPDYIKHSVGCQDAISVVSSQSSIAVKDSERFSDTASDSSASSLCLTSTSVRAAAIERITEPANCSMISIEDLTEIHSDKRESCITVPDMTSKENKSTTTVNNTNFSDSVKSKKSNHSISVEEWYNDLVANDQQIIDSSFDSVPGIDAIETTFEDEDSQEVDELTDLTESMHNLTQFIGNKNFSHTRSESSVLLIDDFSYLAGVVSGTEQHGDSRTGSMTPDIRDSSLLFLGNYIQSQDSLVTKKSSIESLGLFTSIQQQTQMTRSHESHDTSVEWIMDTHLHRSGQNYGGSKHANNSSVLVVSDYNDKDLSCGDEDTASDVSSILRVNQQMQQQKHQGGVEGSKLKTPSPAQQVLNPTTPQLGATELKLRALTVNLENLARGTGASAAATATELERVSSTTLNLYMGTRGLMALPTSVTMLSELDQQRVATVERSNRTLLMAGLWSIIGATMDNTNSKAKENCDMIRAYLDIEWDRRTILHEKMGCAIPPQLWQV